jgi:hypothetical protein
MKRELSKRLGIKIPNDEVTPEEKELVDILCNNVIEEIYCKLPTDRMKAITAMHFELGYDQETLGKMFKVKQEQIALDIRNIKKVLLGKPYRPHKRKKQLTLDQVLTLIASVA